MNAVGVDVGGSKLAAGLVDLTSGEILRLTRRPTNPEEGGPAILRACVELALEVAGGTSAPVGVGICEFVDPAGRLASGVTVDWRDCDVDAAFAALGHVRVESDVRAAARAEARFGAGAGYGAFLYVTVGTGISFCHVVGGAPYPGARGHAIVVGAPAVELVASGRALAARAGVEDAGAVVGDPAFASIVEDGARELGRGLACLVNAFDPDAVVIGGGLGLVPSYRGRAVVHARTLIDGVAVRDLPIVAAGLGEQSGVVGAALAVAIPPIV